MGNEIRRDYLLDRWVIIAANRGKRPEDFKVKAERIEGSRVCVFCPGNEHMTPPEISRVEREGDWIIRSFPNLYAATHNTRARARRGPSRSLPAYGRHEVIVETPDHDGVIQDLSVEHLTALLGEYQVRIDALNRLKGVKYALVFKNYGRVAGASLYHTHSQVVGLPMVPPMIREEARQSSKGGRCVLCSVLKRELKSARKVFEDEHVGAFTPFASRFPFEVWIQPKRHVKSIGEMTAPEKGSFAGALKYVVKTLSDGIGRTPYNFHMHTSPRGADLHFHLEFCPKISKIAGFELGTGMYINVVAPEKAAEFYRRGNI
ncbi:MAG: DUF4931 domain-containing protein [Candidatus Altiarchaeota archaeon]